VVQLVGGGAPGQTPQVLQTPNAQAATPNMPPGAL
jgi:hypothetical protein